MPRGNDSAAAAQELSARLGGVKLNAEELIKRNAARWPAELRAANGKPVDWAASDKLDPTVAQRAVAGESVLDYHVRGEYLVVVSVDAQGMTSKRAFVLKALQSPAPAAPVAAPVHATKPSRPKTTTRRRKS